MAHSDSPPKKRSGGSILSVCYNDSALMKTEPAGAPTIIGGAEVSGEVERRAVVRLRSP